RYQRRSAAGACFFVVSAVVCIGHRLADPRRAGAHRTASAAGTAACVETGRSIPLGAAWRSAASVRKAGTLLCNRHDPGGPGRRLDGGDSGLSDDLTGSVLVLSAVSSQQSAAVDGAGALG